MSIFPVAGKAVQLATTIFSQMGWSAVSFILTFFFVRVLTPDEFGLFGLILAGKRGVITIIGAALVIPITVIHAELIQEQRKIYIQKLTNSLYVFCLLIALISVCVALFTTWIVAIVSLFLLGFIGLEVSRRINYIQHRINIDCIGAIVNIILITVLMAFVHVTGSIKMSVVLFAVSVIVLGWVFLSLGGVQLDAGVLSVGEYKKLWNIGRWGLSSNFSTYAYSEISTLYTMTLMGTSAVAVLELGRQFVAVLQTLLFGMANYFHPRIAASAIHDTPKVFISKLAKLTAVQILLAMIILGLLLLFSPYILELIVPNKLEEYANAIPVAAILALAGLMRIGWQQAGFALVALDKPNFSFLARVIGALIAIPSGYFLTNMYALEGAAWTKVVGDVCVLLPTSYLIFRVIRERSRQFAKTVK